MDNPSDPASEALRDVSVLLLACSATKRHDGGYMPAADRYDGPIWRTWRAYRELRPGVSTFVVSAQFGVIDVETLIYDYDAQLGRDVAVDDLVPLVRAQASRCAALRGSVAFVGGRLYASLLERAGVDARRLSAGGIGEQRQALRLWLASRRSP